MSNALLAEHGAVPSNKNPRYAPIYTDRFFTGLYTNRSFFRDPSDLASLRFYGGAPDSLIGGQNVELTNKLILSRRPGLTQFSPETYPTPPLACFSFELINGQIQVLVDTGSTPTFNLSAIDEISGVAYYHFSSSQSSAANNAYEGLSFQVEGFDEGPNNGVFTCTGSTSSYLILANSNAVTDTSSATAVSSGAVYYDPQNSQDTFARASYPEDPLSDGGSWTTTPSFSPAEVTASGVCQPTAVSANCGAYWSSLEELTDQFSQVTIAALSGTSPVVLPQVRINPETNSWYQLNINGPAGTSQINGIIRSIGGTTDALGVFSATAHIGDVWRLEVVGTTLTAYQNGVVMLTVTDSTLVSGAPGFFLTTGTAIADVQISNWKGGAPPVGKQLLFAKSPGAGQTHFVASGGTCYMGDGVDTRIYTPLNPNGTIWNWGIAPPTVQPILTLTPSGSAATPWVADTVFSTMGLIVDPNGNAQQLYSVNATGQNPPPAVLGSSGTGAPNFNTATGATTTDGSVHWTCQGPITLWQANTTFNSGAAIYDPATNCIFVQSHSAARQSGGTRPAFNATLGLSGARIDDTSGSNNARWECLGVVNGSPTAVLTWKKNTAYSQYTQPSGGTDPSNTNSAIVYPLVPNSANMAAYVAGTGPAIYLFGATTSGTSANTNYNPWTGISSQSVGAVTQDFNPGLTSGLEWLCLGSATWVALTDYTAWTTSGDVFSAIKDTNGNMQVCTSAGLSGSNAPTWQTNYGAVTQDGGVSWTCVGPPVTWAVTTQWYLPINGFVVPSKAQPYGGSEVVGSSYVQAVISSGKSGGSGPSWSVIVGGTTADSGITWKTVAAASTNSLSWQTGYVYAYSFGARLASDYYNTNAPPGLNGIYPNGLGAPTGSETGGINTISPIYTINGGNTGSVNTVSGYGSTDPQVDTIFIFRSADGGGSANLYYLTEIPAPASKAGVAQPWSFNDWLPDVASTINGVQYPGLNELIPAPQDGTNNPPPSTALPQVFNFERIWCANGQQVIFSGGPDVLTGDPNSSFSASDEFPYLANVTRCVKNSQGLVVFLTNEIDFIAGGPSTASFYDVTLAQGVGLASWSALDIYAGEVYMLSSAGQALIISPSLSISDFGYGIADQILTLNPSEAYLAYQQVANDNAVYLGNGSTGWYRANPYTTPGNAAGPNVTWSPFATIASGYGCGMVQTVEVSAGIKKVLVGGTGANEPLLERNLNIFTDGGTSATGYGGNTFDANFTIGNLVLAHPGQISCLKFLECDFSGQNFQPTVSFLLDEIGAFNGAAFVPFTLAPIQDPPSLYGTTRYALTYSPQRYYFSGTGSLARCRSIQLNVDFGQTANQDTIYSFTLFGKLLVEA